MEKMKPAQTFWSAVFTSAGVIAVAVLSLVMGVELQRLNLWPF